MIKNIGISLVGLLVGLVILGASWIVAVGVCWGIAAMFNGLFTLLPFMVIVIGWIFVIMVAIVILVLSWGIGSNVVKGYKWFK